MAEYRLINQTKIDSIIEKITLLTSELNSLMEILKKTEATVIFPDQQALFPSQDSNKIKIAPFKKEGDTLADVLYKKIPLTEFTPRQAYEIIKDYVEMNAKRPLDSIRSALNRDSRFRKISWNKFKKREK